MTKLLLSLTTISVLAHALFGCCSHSIDAASSQLLSSAMEVSSERSDSCGHHQHVHSHGKTSPCPCQSDSDHDCRHANCNWLSSDSSLDFSIATTLFHVSYMASENISLCDPILVTQNLSLIAIWQPPALPVRSHLALGILLI
jgi:hypothetical protein